MRNFHSFEPQKHRSSVALPFSFAPRVRPFAAIPSPSPVSAPHHGQASLGHARHFGHSLDRCSLFPPVHHAAPPAHEEPQINYTGQQKRDVQDVPQASMESLSVQPVQAKKRPYLGWNIAHIPLFPDPETLPSANTRLPVSVGQRLLMRGTEPRPDLRSGLPSALHPFVSQLIQRRGSDEAQEHNVMPPENHTGLPDKLKAGIENLSGISLDDVQVHYNSSKPAQVQALAYTQGTEIHIGPGQEKHLAHEAWHVVQQKQGRVKPTLQAKGMAINDEQGLEKEADVMGKQAIQKAEMMHNAGPGNTRVPRLQTTTTASPAPLQMQAYPTGIEETKVGEKAEEGYYGAIFEHALQSSNGHPEDIVGIPVHEDIENTHDDFKIGEEKEEEVVKGDNKIESGGIIKDHINTPTETISKAVEKKVNRGQPTMSPLVLKRIDRQTLSWRWPDNRSDNPWKQFTQINIEVEFNYSTGDAVVITRSNGVSNQEPYEGEKLPGLRVLPSGWGQQSSSSKK